MSFQRIVALPTCWLVSLACGEDLPPPASDAQRPCTDCADSGVPVAGSGSGGNGAASSAGSGGAASGGSAGSNAGGAAGSASLPECGNAVQEAGEACDGDDFGNAGCASFGFSDGALSCAACVVDASGCSGNEVCSDGSDNDGDGDADCADADCDLVCSNFCAAPTPLQDAVLVSGAVLGQLAPVASSCSPGEASGQVVFAYEAPLTGVADVSLAGLNADFSVSARSDCEQANSELTCSPTASGSAFDALLRVPVVQGELLYVVVESANREASSAFQLIAAAREVACGDGYVDADEECDDGNFASDDGCSSECAFQPDEVEPNSSVETANAYAPAEFFAAIEDADDVDVVAIEVAAGQKLIVQTFDLGDGGCARFELDNMIEVLDGVGTVLGSDDDGGTGFCAALATDALSAGTYHVRVSASGIAESFLYRLSLTLED